MYKGLRIFFKWVVIVFAVIGFVFVSGYIAMKLGLTKTIGVVDTQTSTFIEQKDQVVYAPFPLAHTPEWIAFRQAIVKDKDVIEKVSKVTGISPRLLIAILVPEQMRLFHSNRPLFKKVFEPLKLLGNQSQFSWGLFGIKDGTARAVESHLLDATSPYYLGPASEHALDFVTNDHNQERFERIVNEQDHTYSYLYAALFVSQINSQWKKAGFPIDTNTAVQATLWNLGFDKSSPKMNPASGGAEIDIEGTIYSFGALAQAFYDSDELIELFPKQ